MCCHWCKSWRYLRSTQTIATKKRNISRWAADTHLEMVTIKNTISNTIHSANVAADPTDPPKKRLFQWPDRIESGFKIAFPSVGKQPIPGQSTTETVGGIGFHYAASANLGKFKINGTLGFDYVFPGNSDPNVQVLRSYGEHHPIAGYRYQERLRTESETIGRLDIASLGFEIPIGNLSIGLGAVLGFNTAASRSTQFLQHYKTWDPVTDCDGCVNDRNKQLSSVKVGESVGNEKGAVISLRPEIAYTFDDFIKLGVSYTNPIAGKKSTHYATLSMTLWLDEM